MRRLSFLLKFLCYSNMDNLALKWMCQPWTVTFWFIGWFFMWLRIFHVVVYVVRCMCEGECVKMGVWLAVKVKHRFPSSSNKAYKMEPSSSFGDLSLRLSDLKEDEHIGKIEINSTSKNFKMEVSVETPIAICNQFSAFLSSSQSKLRRQRKVQRRRYSKVWYLFWWAKQKPVVDQRRQKKITISTNDSTT